MALFGCDCIYHQDKGIGNKLLTPREFSEKGPKECQSDLGGMLNYYYREAA